MKSFHLNFVSILIISILLGCKTDPPPVPDKEFVFDYQLSAEGWIGGFADFPVGADSTFYGFNIEHAPLPSPLDANQNTLKISGDNHSDDLFMYFKTQLSGLEPNTTYEMEVEVELASNAPTNSFGVGGSPASVYIKAGASTAEPDIEADPSENWWRMNIDKGNQSQGGADMQVLGTIGIPGDAFVYQLIQLDNTDQTFSVTTDSQGKVWVIVGSDSAFEAVTTLYYNKIEVRFTAE